VAVLIGDILPENFGLTTYIKVRGRWSYLYRAVDKQGRTVDFFLSEKRDVTAAKRFFRKALRRQGVPRVITIRIDFLYCRL